VLQRPERSADAMIALSLSSRGEDQLLGAARDRRWNAEAGLIVLSGCSSGAAAARPGAGLMGLTRAWLMPAPARWLRRHGRRLTMWVSFSGDSIIASNAPKLATPLWLASGPDRDTAGGRLALATAFLAAYVAFGNE